MTWLTSMSHCVASFGLAAVLLASAKEPSGRTVKASAVSLDAVLPGSAKIGTACDAVRGAAASLRNQAYGTACPAAFWTRRSLRSP
ncbi:hypothetical protein D9M72_341400 [compost metagenome]